MKLTVSKDLLMSALRRVLNVISTRTPLPVLNNVLLETVDDKLVLVGTDLEVSMRTEVPVTVAEPGNATVMAKKFGQIISVLPDGDVLLETDANYHTKISCKKSFFKIVGTDSAEFPRESPMENGWSFTTTCGDFQKLLSKVSYAASPDESRRVLNGILLSMRGGALTAAATDGRRLALIEKPLPGGAPGEGDVILPPKVVSEAQRIGEPSESLTVQLTERRVAFKTGSTLITSKLVDGNYPNYRQVVPAAFAQSVIVPKAELQAVLNRVSMVVSETSASVKLKLEKAQATVSATSSEFGESSEPIEVSYEGKPLQIAFNPGFLIDPLKFLDCEQVVIKFNDEYSPVSIEGDEGFLYIIMPMRV
jgi:DNA polymerase III subunit beta